LSANNDALIILVIRCEKFIEKLAMYLSYGCLVKLFWFSVLLLCFLVNIMVNKDEYISKMLLK